MIEIDATHEDFNLTPTGEGLVRIAILPIPSVTGGVIAFYLKPEESIALGERLTKMGVQTRWNQTIQPTHGESHDVIS